MGKASKSKDKPKDTAGLLRRLLDWIAKAGDAKTVRSC